MCAIGRSGTNSGVINGNWSYMGIDSSNENKPYWHSECFDAAIEWGVKYSASNNFYVIKRKNVTAYYGFCTLADTDPFNCDDSWNIWNGAGYELDTDFIVENCTYFTVGSPFLFVKSIILDFVLDCRQHTSKKKQN